MGPRDHVCVICHQLSTLRCCVKNNCNIGFTFELMMTSNIHLKDSVERYFNVNGAVFCPVHGDHLFFESVEKILKCEYSINSKAY